MRRGNSGWVEDNDITFITIMPFVTMIVMLVVIVVVVTDNPLQNLTCQIDPWKITDNILMCASISQSSLQRIHINPDSIMQERCGEKVLTGSGQEAGSRCVNTES